MGDKVPKLHTERSPHEPPLTMQVEEVSPVTVTVDVFETPIADESEPVATEGDSGDAPKDEAGETVIVGESGPEPDVKPTIGRVRRSR